MVAGIGETRSGDGVRADCHEHDKRRKRHALVGPIDPLRAGLQEHLVSGTVAQPNHDVDRDPRSPRSEEHTSELQSPCNLVCRLLLEKKKKLSINLQEDAWIETSARVDIPTRTP